MTNQIESVTLQAFEAAMQRCADEAGQEVSFAQDADGGYLQPEMRRALTGWLGAASLVADQLRGFSDFAVVQFRRDPAFQSGFLQFLEQAADLLSLSSDQVGSSRVPDLTEPGAPTGAAAFDDAALDGFNRVLKAKMAAGRAKGRTGWWGAPVEELSVMLRAHVDKGDPLDIALLAMMHWYKHAPVAPVPARPAEIFTTGELTKISSSPVMGGQLDIRTSSGPIGICGLPNELARDCKPLLWEQVEIVIRAANVATAARGTTRSAPAAVASLEWLAASRAAYQVGVDLDTVLAWAAADEIEYRHEDGTIMVRCASLLARSHQHRMDRSVSAFAAGDDTEREAVMHGATTVVAEHKA
ncbi:hypothetical protein [Burkholderia cepacia]|uniref:hypothetical protein n=1 Tax=Burkholderia cepacia TaxID=292 RepID=UPI0007C780E4|nr:hypothetical protein [Burkholderia cepacia]